MSSFSVCNENPEENKALQGGDQTGRGENNRRENNRRETDRGEENKALKRKFEIDQYLNNIRQLNPLCFICYVLNVELFQEIESTGT